MIGIMTVRFGMRGDRQHTAPNNARLGCIRGLHE